MNACTDALFAVFKGHILAFACQELGIENIDSDLDNPTIKRLSNEEKRKYIVGLSMKIVENCTIIGDAILGSRVEESGDKKYDYARTFCHYAALALEFYDAWHEGDGLRILRCWRIFIPHFYESGRTKYSLEALRLQMQIKSLPHYLVQQITWDRFINTHGGLGHNIPCDLHNEHVNKLLKGMIRHMGANFSQNALTNIARSVTYMSSVTNIFDQQCGIIQDSVAHTTKDDVSDVKRVVNVVKSEKLWKIHKGRAHRNFKTISSDPLTKLDKSKLDKWIHKKLTEYKKYNQLNEGNVSDNEGDATDCQTDSD